MKRVFTSLLALILTLSLAACGEKAPTWQEQYDLGQRYLTEGNYEEAILAFEALRQWGFPGLETAGEMASE